MAAIFTKSYFSQGHPRSEFCSLANFGTMRPTAASGFCGTDHCKLAGQRSVQFLRWQRHQCVQQPQLSLSIIVCGGKNVAGMAKT